MQARGPNRLSNWLHLQEVPIRRAELIGLCGGKQTYREHGISVGIGPFLPFAATQRFVEGMDRGQSTLFPECLEDWIDENNPVRVIDVFVEELDLGELGFDGVDPEATGRPSYHPSVLLRSAI